MTRRRRWAYLAVTWWAMASSTMQQFTIVVLAATLIDDLGIARWQVGILGATNTGVGALLSPRLGRFADRLGCRRSMTALGIASAAGLLCTAVATSYWWLIAASAIAGLGQGAGTPVTNKIIAQRVPDSHRGLAAGVSQSGVQASVMLSGMLLPVAASTAGWRWAVAILGFVTLTGALLTQARPRPGPRPRRRSRGRDLGGRRGHGGHRGRGGRRHAAAVARHPAAYRGTPGHTSATSGTESGACRSDTVATSMAPFVYRVAVYSFCLGVTAGGVNRFFPLFAHEVLGFSDGWAGAAVCMGGLVAIAGRLIWARMATGTIAPPKALLVLGVGSAAAVGLLVVTELLGAWILWPAIVLIAFTVSAWNAVAMLAVLQSVPAGLSGQATGVVLMGFLGGLTVAAPVVGYVIDWSGSYQSTWIALGLLALAGAGAVTPVPLLSRVPRPRRSAGGQPGAPVEPCDKRRQKTTAVIPATTLALCLQRSGASHGGPLTPAEVLPALRPADGIVWSSFYCDQKPQDRAHGRHVVDDGRLHFPALRRRRARRVIHR